MNQLKHALGLGDAYDEKRDCGAKLRTKKSFWQRRANAQNDSLLIFLWWKFNYQLVWYLIIYMKKFLHFDWLKSSALFFPKQCRKELIQCKKKKQTMYSDWSMIKETNRWPIKSFVFKSSARPRWRNFSLIAWYACVPSVQPSRNFFINQHGEIFSRILLTGNQMIFVVQFEINKHS